MTVKERILERLETQEHESIADFMQAGVCTSAEWSALGRTKAYQMAIAIITEEFAKEGEDGKQK